MARTIAQIKKEATDLFIAHPVIIGAYGLQPNKTFEDQFSVVSPESIIFYIVASCIWTLEKLFDIHLLEVKTIIDNKTPHSLRWYANVAKDFQYGDNLNPDTDRYDNTGKTPDEVLAAKIVDYAAVVDLQKEGLLIKIAKENGADLEPLTGGEMAAFDEYMHRVKDAGVIVSTLSERADDLKLKLKIYYNPLVLNSQGQRLDGLTLTPIADAVRAFLKNLPFNGVFVPTYLIDALQLVDGVVIPTIELVQVKYGELDWLDVQEIYMPYAGYLRVTDENLVIEYIAQGEIV